MKVALDTLGCKLNQAETELLARQLAEAGYEVVPQVDGADVYILNTCTVTHTADAKSRHRLRLAHHRNPGALVVATGCYAQREPEKLSRIEGVNLVISHDEKSELPRLLEKAGGPPRVRLIRPAIPRRYYARAPLSRFRTDATATAPTALSRWCAGERRAYPPPRLWLRSGSGWPMAIKKSS